MYVKRIWKSTETHTFPGSCIIQLWKSILCACNNPIGNTEGANVAVGSGQRKVFGVSRKGLIVDEKAARFFLGDYGGRVASTRGHLLRRRKAKKDG
jgi:hypothetical protein